VGKYEFSEKKKEENGREKGGDRVFTGRAKMRFWRQNFIGLGSNGSFSRLWFFWGEFPILPIFCFSFIIF